MNEPIEVERLVEVVARAEALRRSDLWTTALSHASLLAIFFLAVLIVTQVASRIWPSFPSLEGAYLDMARLALLAMAGWIFASTWRRNAMTRAIEYDFLRDEIKEIQQRMTHS